MLYFAVASLLCLQALRTQAYNRPVRLLGGKNPYEGRVEIFQNDKWGSVCADGWNLKAARVVCRQLGYKDARRYVRGVRAFGRSDHDLIWLDDVQCQGEEWGLDNCWYRGWKIHDCTTNNLAGVYCKPNLEEVTIKPNNSLSTGNVPDFRIRLAGKTQGSIISEGVFLVFHSDRWGFVCADNWDYNDARVACGQLGFPDADIKYKEKIEYKKRLKFWMTDMRCNGSEATLSACEHKGWGPHRCLRGSVNLKCIRSETNVTTRVLNPLKTRLRGSYKLSEGRVEIRYEGKWGTVCDDVFGINEGNVICRSLGYGTVREVVRASQFGQGGNHSPIHMQGVKCTGKETSLIQCERTNEILGKTKCDHYEEIGVRCNEPFFRNHKVRLVGGSRDNEGRVEVKYNGTWGSVCGAHWELVDAMVVCRQLGLGYASDYIIGDYFGTDGSPIMSGVNCLGDEQSIKLCRHDGWDTVKCKDESRLAGVICVKELPDLVLNIDLMSSTIRIEHIPMYNLMCAYEENCLTSSAALIVNWPYGFTRRLLKFTTRAENRGKALFKPRAPKNAWQWHQCHMHYHSMEAFTHFDLIDHSSRKIAQGHKASFCLEDTGCDRGVEKVFNCTYGGDQGININCFDIYKYNIDCQWIDITDVKPDNYKIRVHINPNNKVAEMDFSNNVGVCDLKDFGERAEATNCHLEECKLGRRTQHGNSNGACCEFPFIYKGNIYWDCTTVGFDRLWCSTTSNHDNDKRWGIC